MKSRRLASLDMTSIKATALVIPVFNTATPRNFTATSSCTAICRQGATGTEFMGLDDILVALTNIPEPPAWRCSASA